MPRLKDFPWAFHRTTCSLSLNLSMRSVKGTDYQYSIAFLKLRSLTIFGVIWRLCINRNQS